VFAILALLTALVPDAQLSDLSAKSLKTLERRAVVVHLASGKELDGTVLRVTDRVLVLEKNGTPTFIELSRIEALGLKTVSIPSRNELDKTAKALAGSMKVSIDWGSLPDDEEETRALLQRAINDTFAALKKVGADKDGQEALAKIDKLSFVLADKTSATLEKSTIVVRFDRKVGTDERTIQSMIEKIL
jgi:hypothetical protein